MRPNVYIIAGPNGAGKTTFAREFLPSYAKCKNFVNADLIAQGVSPFSPETADIRAGKLMLEEIRHFARRGVDFGFETTLSGRAHLKLIRSLKRRRFGVNIFYLWVPSVEVALSRVRERVSGEGTILLNLLSAVVLIARCGIFWPCIGPSRIRGFYLTTRINVPLLLPLRRNPKSVR